MHSVHLIYVARLYGVLTCSSCPSPSGLLLSIVSIADSLLSTSEVWSQSPIRDIGGVDGESNKSAM